MENIIKILGIICFAGGVINFFYFNAVIKDINCIKDEQMKETHFRSKVVRKYINYEFSAAHVYILDDKLEWSISSGYFGNLYNYISEGDSLYKPKGQLKLYIYKADSDSTYIYKLEHGCKDE